MVNLYKPVNLLDLPSGQHLHNELERSTMFNVMGKFSISTGPYATHYQRLYDAIHIPEIYQTSPRNNGK